MTTEPRLEGPDAALREYASKDVLVLGSTGFIGRWVVRALARAGARVHLAARDVSAARSLRQSVRAEGDVLALDATNPEGVSGWIRDVRPCVTFNLVGYGVGAGERDEAQALRINGGFVRSLCELLSGADAAWPGATLVHAGSQLEYGPIGGRLEEDAVEAPDTIYGRSKLEGTRAVRAAASQGLRGITVRLFNVYGAGEREGRLLPSLVAVAGTGRSVDLTAGLQELDFVYVEDVAEGLIRLGAAKAPPGSVVNLATGVLTRVRDFALTAADALEMPRELLRFGSLPARANEMRYEPVSTARLRRLTGWTPQTTVAEGIRRALREKWHVTG